MKKLKNYFDEDGGEWEIYTRKQGFWLYYYIGKVEKYGFPNNVPKNIKFAFAINGEHDYNGHKQKVIKEAIESYTEKNKYMD